MDKHLLLAKLRVPALAQQELLGIACTLYERCSARSIHSFTGIGQCQGSKEMLLTWYLVAAESRISKQSGVQDALQNSELCTCLKTLEDLSTQCNELCKIARALNLTAISKYVTLKMADVPSKHIWKIKESCYVYTMTY